MQDNGTKDAKWASHDGKTHTLYIKQAVTHLTVVKPEVVVGQIHGNANDVTVFFLEANMRPFSGAGLCSIYISDSDNHRAYKLSDHYTLGSVFQVKFVVSGDRINYYFVQDGTSEPALVNYSQTKAFSGAFFNLNSSVGTT